MKARPPSCLWECARRRESRSLAWVRFLLVLCRGRGTAMLAVRIYRPRPMEISATTEDPAVTGADTIALGVFEGEELGQPAPPELSALVASGEARSSFKALALAHAGG